VGEGAPGPQAGRQAECACCFSWGGVRALGAVGSTPGGRGFKVGVLCLALVRAQAGRRQVSEALALKADVAAVDMVVEQLRREAADAGVALGRKADAGELSEVRAPTTAVHPPTDKPSPAQSRPQQDSLRPLPASPPPPPHPTPPTLLVHPRPSTSSSGCGSAWRPTRTPPRAPCGPWALRSTAPLRTWEGGWRAPPVRRRACTPGACICVCLGG
jgi:hypothetical protein